LILRDLDCPAYEVADAIQMASLPGLLEAVASYESVGLYFDPAVFAIETLWSLDFAGSKQQHFVHTIPVCYELGDDLQEVATTLGLTADDVIGLHASTSYRCFAVGFCPGFAYLGYLPDKLVGIARRPTPRVRVPPGSVAITGRQTGVYPLERPGGWAIIGRTPFCLVDVESAYFPIKAGDELRFVPIKLNEFESLKGMRL